MKRPTFILAEPDVQVAFSDRLTTARREFLQQAVLEALGSCDIVALDLEAHKYVPHSALSTLAKRGLRPELVFALPALLLQNPRLLGYYRLVLGFSQKAFYHRSTGMSEFKTAEDRGVFSEKQQSALPSLCLALNRAGAVLLQGIEGSLSASHIEDLSLLTYGAQLRGGHNVAIGVAAVRRVFDAIRDLVGDRAGRVEDRLIVFINSTGRTVEILFGSDPDIQVCTVHQGTGARAPLLAIEVKGGTDLSNAHNRLGEAEKSHLKAKKKGFNDLWTIINVVGLSEEARHRGSPTTTAFFDLIDIVAREGDAYDDFRERLLQKLGLPNG